MSDMTHDEETPLLIKHDVYDRFTTAQKHVCVALVSWASLIPCECDFRLSTRHAAQRASVLLSGSFVPLIPEV